ncbi:hypothetical protein Dimus_032466 [Dionaea muscipula]
MRLTAWRRSLVSLLCFLCYLVVSTSSVSVAAEEEEEEEFHEELLLKPLPDRKVLAHFHFETRVNFSSSFNGGRHRHHLRFFPKSIYQLVHKFHVREMELSFTTGRWNYENWGGFDPTSSNNAKPPGVELWALFDVPPSQVDVFWKNLTHALSGLFCASINFLESSTSYSAPEWGFRTFSGNIRYGTLPREAVCTENLTPWLKLLPCRDKAGLSELMDRPSIYRGFYHSQRLRLTSGELHSTEPRSGIRLEQTLTIVLDPRSQSLTMRHFDDGIIQPSWSMSSIFGRKVRGRCVLAKSSNVYLQLDSGLVTELKKVWTENVGLGFDIATIDTLSDSVFRLSVASDKVIRGTVGLNKESVLYLFLIEKHVAARPFDLALSWKRSVVWHCSQAPLLANRFLMGAGNERGTIAISLKSDDLMERYLGFGQSDESCTLRVDVFQIVPWYIKIYYHTLQIILDGDTQPISNIIEKMRVNPSEDKVSPGILELVLKFPCDMNSAVITLEFDKGFMHINEYPPDANQGFDIPSAIVSFPEFLSCFHFDDDSNWSPMLSTLKERTPALAYTEVLLVPLTTPDFSMPYNVITITCTVFALYFGSLLNVLRRRVGEEERLSKDRGANGYGFPVLHRVLLKLSTKFRGRQLEPLQPSPPPTSSTGSKMVLKIFLVAGIAVAWQYYFK